MGGDGLGPLEGLEMKAIRRNILFLTRGDFRYLFHNMNATLYILYLTSVTDLKKYISIYLITMTDKDVFGRGIFAQNWGKTHFPPQGMMDKR